MRQSGFSLLELSIVLVIIGLLAGGVMTGQALIRAAELRSVSTDFSRYKTAMYAFRDKYQALPGDMKNATSFWGAQAGSTAPGVDATCAALTTPATGTATCNGNGDGRISMFSTEFYEGLRFWQHLTNAGMIEGSFTGIAGTGPTYAVGVNVAASKINTAGFAIVYLNNRTAATDSIFDGSYMNTFFFGGEHPTYFPNVAVLKPEEAWNVDTKLDDGKPGFGFVRTYTPAGRANCTTAADSTALYLLSDSGLRCPLLLDTRM